MRREMFAAALLAAGISGAAAKDERSIVVDKMSEAMVVDLFCNTLTLDAMRVALITAALGYPSESLMADVVERGKYFTARLKDMPPSVLCTLGESLYGENGTNAVGWLVKG